MKKLIAFSILIFALFVPRAGAQCAYTTVSGTVKDASGVPYSFANVAADLVPSPPGTPLCSGQPFSGHIVTQANSAGTFSFLVPPNGSITPGSSQWQFTVSITPGVALPFGTGPQSFSATVTVSGATQSLSTTLSNAAPTLTVSFGSGGGTAFSAITSGTNTTAAMLVGTGGSFAATGSGTIAATTAATLATPRTIAGSSFNGSANISLANNFIVQGTSDSGLSGAQFLGALSSGLLKNTITTGVLSIAAAADIYGLWSGSCSSSTYLNGAGTCATPSGVGTVTTTGSPASTYLSYFTGASSISGNSGATADSSGHLTAASYTTSGSNGGMTGAEGTGANTTPASGSDIFYADSANHCWHQNLNNVDVGCTPALGLASTFTATQTFGTITPTTISGNVNFSGTPTGLTAAEVGLGSVTNNAQTQAAIVPNTAPTAGGLLVGNAGGTAYAPVAASGDCTLASTGALTCTKSNGTAFNGIATAASTSVSETLGALTLGSSGVAGSVVLNGATSGTGTISLAATGGTINLGSTNITASLGGTLNFTTGIMPSSGIINWNGGTQIKETGGNGFLSVLNSAGTSGAIVTTGNKVFVTTDFTDSTSTTLTLVTGLSYTLAASTAQNFSFHCSLLFDQGTAAVSDQIGVGVTGTAPTNLNASAVVYPSTSTLVAGTLTGLATTTATSVVTFTPSATGTIWNAVIDGTIEQPSNATPGVFGIYVSTATGTDNLIVKRGSFCTIQ